MAENEVFLTSVGDLEKSPEPHDQFKDRMLMLNALACSNYKAVNFDVNEAISESNDSLMALGATGALQQMLVAQMTSIHRLQQRSVAMANEATIVDNMRYFTNAAIKLANCFTQQAAFLAKLQGNGSQKIVVEHVEVHQGGQAVVGNISGGGPSHKEKK